MQSPEVFAGKTVLVTGAARGIGRAIALAFADAGADIVALDIGDAATGALPRYPLASAADLRDIGGEVARRGRRVWTRAVDVRDARGVEAAFAAAEEAAGGLDVVCHVAGVSVAPVPLTDVTDAQWDEAIGINLTGTFNVFRAALRALIANGGGSLVALASMAGLVGLPNRASYTAAKHGIVGLVKATAAEMADKNVYVNCICPGIVDSPMTRAASAARAAERSPAADEPDPVARLHVVPELVQPEDVADAALYLAGTHRVTGIALPVSAGWGTV